MAGAQGQVDFDRKRHKTYLLLDFPGFRTRKHFAAIKKTSTFVNIHKTFTLSLLMSAQNPEESIFSKLEAYGHKKVVFCSDPETGLKAIIAIHDTTLGPALGGTRMWAYKTESEALQDVLRLSKAMTYKASIAGLNLGGGKAVIIGDSR